MFFYFLYKLGYILTNVLPLSVAYWMAERISDIQYSFSKKDRDAVIENLRIVLKKDTKACRMLAKKVFRNFGLYLVDFFRINRLDKEFVKKRVQVVGLDNLKSVLKENKGIIALTAHIGSWEMGGVVVAIMGYDISAVALNHKYRSINNFFIRQRAEKGLKVITKSSTMKRCVSALLGKGILALLGDRDFTNTGITLDFFGMPTSIPKGPALLSLRTNSPVIPVFFVRHERFSYKLIFDKPIEVNNIPGLKDDEIIRRATNGFIPIMEKYIREYPDQWLLFRRFWETPVDAVVI